MKAQIKGRKSWKPATLLAVNEHTPGIKHRWCNKDSADIAKKLAEGWQFADKSKLSHDKPDATLSLNLPEPVGAEAYSLGTSITEYRDCVLMTIDDETLAARTEYYDERTDAQCITPNKFKEFAQTVFAKGGVDSSTLFDNIE
jgi:hypothetical protein